MKWQDPYKAGQVRIRRHFLFFPRTIKGITRWLERAAYKQMSVHNFYKWKVREWVKISEIEFNQIEQNKTSFGRPRLYSTLSWEDIEWIDLVDWSDLSSDSILKDSI